MEALAIPSLPFYSIHLGKGGNGYLSLGSWPQGWQGALVEFPGVLHRGYLVNINRGKRLLGRPDVFILIAQHIIVASFYRDLLYHMCSNTCCRLEKLFNGCKNRDATQPACSCGLAQYYQICAGPEPANSHRKDK